MAAEKKWVKKITDIITDEGIKVIDFERTKNHLKFFTILPDGRPQMFVTSSSMSDNRRGLKNFKSTVRQYAKQHARG
jgi:cell division GTPase FtsZ